MHRASWSRGNPRFWWNVDQRSNQASSSNHQRQKETYCPPIHIIERTLLSPKSNFCPLSKAESAGLRGFCDANKRLSRSRWVELRFDEYRQGRSLLYQEVNFLVGRSSTTGGADRVDGERSTEDSEVGSGAVYLRLTMGVNVAINNRLGSETELARLQKESRW